MEFKFPDTGEGVTEGEFLEWLVEEGEQVEEDQVVAEAETDKAVVDIPAPSDGTVSELKVKPGDTVEVGQVIMVLDAEGESSGEPEEPEEGPEQETVEEKEEQEPEEGNDLSSAEVEALPRVRKLAEERGIDLESLDAEGRITEENVKNAASKDEAVDEQHDFEEDESGKEEENEAEVPEGVNATPATRRLAREEGVDLGNIEGSGRDGKILREDVLEAAGTATEEAPDDESSQISGESERVEMSALRRQVADRMEESRFTAPHVTHVEKADVTELHGLKEREKENVEPHLTYLPFVVRATQLALTHFPDLNAELDKENDEIVRYRSHDFNIAVDTERGLMVPLLKNVGSKSIVELAGEIGEKAERARRDELEADEMRNGTFSITNLGVIGGEEFTPIINYPQVAILGVGAIRETAEVVNGEVEPRRTVKLSLSYDHRVVDGADAARFMNRVVENLEDPEKLLMQL